MVKIIKIESLQNHYLHIFFDDGCDKVVDFNPYIKDDKLTSALKDIDYFKKVMIYENGRGIYWTNGYDFCPDNLRYHIPAVENIIHK